MSVVIGITAAYAYSVVAFAMEESDVELEQKAFFGTSTLLITLVLLGRLIATIARTRAVRAVPLISSQADRALLPSLTESRASLAAVSCSSGTRLLHNHIPASSPTSLLLQRQRRRRIHAYWRRNVAAIHLSFALHLAFLACPA